MSEWYVRIDFHSDEAFYVQLCNQIIQNIADSTLQPGDNLPSVRELAETIGINMHTVNKAYGILRQEGYLKLDRRKGAVVSIDPDKERIMEQLRQQMRILCAQGICRGITREEVRKMIDDIYDNYEG